MQVSGLNPVDYGWENNEATKSLYPVMLPKNIKLAQPEVLHLIKCSCGSESPCGTLRRPCNSSLLSCTIFCEIQGYHLLCMSRGCSVF